MPCAYQVMWCTLHKKPDFSEHQLSKAYLGSGTLETAKIIIGINVPDSHLTHWDGNWSYRSYHNGPRHSWKMWGYFKLNYLYFGECEWFIVNIDMINRLSQIRGNK